MEKKLPESVKKEVKQIINKFSNMENEGYETDYLSKPFMHITGGNVSGKPSRYPFWISIRKASSCLFSRRNGYIGKIIFGYSVCIRLFNKDIL